MNLIINADDFGWDQDANQAILDLCKNGKIHAVSIMANWVDTDSLRRLLFFQPKVRLGLHLVLNEGKPLSRPHQISSLVDERGNFRSSYQLWIRYLLGRVKREHLEIEIGAQIAFLRNNGVQLTHADSHQHIHQFPFMSDTILSVLEQEGIKSVRNSMPLERNDLRRKVLSIFCWMSRNNLKGFKSNDLLVTYLATHADLSAQDLGKILGDLEAQSVNEIELMCHPALSDKKGSYLRRRKEFDFLRSSDLVKSPLEAIFQTR